MGYETLIVERKGRVGWLINNRPDQLNAMNSKMREEFAEAWLELDRDPEVRVIVHTGEGRAFQTGVDVVELATDGQGMERYRESVEKFDLHFTSWHQKVRKPVITAVNGICCGGGFHWVADADIVIAASDVQFFDPHVSVGQVVALEAIALLKKMPAETVMRMALMGGPRADGGPTGLRTGHDQRDRRSARAPEGASRRDRRGHRPQLPFSHGRHQEGPMGRHGIRAHRGQQDRRLPHDRDMGPPRPNRRPRRLRRKTRAPMGTPRHRMR